LTATPRCGFHQYTFPASDQAHVILDLVHGVDNRAVAATLQVEGGDTISGSRISQGWGGRRAIYFVMQFSKPFASFGIEQNGKRLAADARLVVEHHAIGLPRRSSDGREHRPLPAHVLDHGVHVRLGHRGRRPLDGEALGRVHPDLGQHLEMGGIFQARLRPHRNRLDARPAGRPELFLPHGLCKGAAHQVAQHLGAHLLAKLLGDDRKRRLARAKALQARGARQALQALLHLAGHFGGGHSHFEAP